MQVASEGTSNGSGWRFLKAVAALVLPGTWAPRLAALGLMLFVVSAGIPSQYEEILIVPAVVLFIGASVLIAYRIDIDYRGEPRGIGASFLQLFGLFRCIFGIAFLDEDGPEGYEKPGDKSTKFILAAVVLPVLSVVTGVLVALVAANGQYFSSGFHARYLGLVGRSEVLIMAPILWVLIGVPNQWYKVTRGKNASTEPSLADSAEPAVVGFVTAVSCVLTATYLILLHFGGGPLSKVRGPLGPGIVFTAVLVVPAYKSLARRCCSRGLSGVLDVTPNERSRTMATEVQVALNQPARRQASEGGSYPPQSRQQPAPPLTSPGNGGGPPSGWAAQVTSGLAIASLMLSILWLGGLGSLLAIIFGFMALWQIRQSRGKKQGAGFAAAGLVIGGVGLLGLVLLYTVETMPTKVTAATFTFQLPADWTANTAVAKEPGFYVLVEAYPDDRSGNMRVAVSAESGHVLGSVAQARAAMPGILRLRGKRASLVAGPAAISLGNGPAIEFQYDVSRGRKEFFGEQVQTVHAGFLYILQVSTGANDKQVPAVFQKALKTWVWL